MKHTRNDKTAENRLRLPDELPKDYIPTPETGLTEEEAARRRQAGEANILSDPPGKSLWEIIRDNVFSLFNLLNFALAACLILVGSYRNMLFLFVVLWNTLIAIVQEVRAKRTIERLTLLNAPHVSVIRDGGEKTLTPQETVRGDLVILRAGDQVIADAVVRSGHGTAMESLLTGESNAIPKGKDAWLYSGSYLHEGRVTAQLVYVGDESYTGRLTGETRNARGSQSGLMNELKRLIRWDTAILVPLGVLQFLKQYFLQHLPPERAVPSSVAAMLGMIPEGLMLLTSIALAVGVVRLARRKVLVQELYGIETLARTDVLCLDKTGTITSGKMRLQRMEPVEAAQEELKQSLSRFLGAFDERSGTLDALRAAVPGGMEKPTELFPFSSEKKKSAAGFADGTTLILGAPAYVMGQRLPKELAEKIARWTGEGSRVLLLAESHGRPRVDAPPDPERILGLLVLGDELRPHIQDIVQYLREQDVTLKVISGDDPRTVSMVARKAGLEGWDRATDLTGVTSPEKIGELCEKYTIFGRVNPAQKKMLVEALKRKGHSVGMTGDGVNDIPAMKAADCSIAMAEGADAAKDSAQLTLLNSDFAVVPDIMLEGRRVINNITRSASMFLTKTVFSLLLSLFTLILPGTYPFQPIQMSLVSGLTVGIPGMFLALEPSRERISGNFLKTVLLRALPGGMSIAVCATAAMHLESWGFSAAVCSTMATWLAGIVSAGVLLKACWPLTKLRGAVAAGSLIGFIGIGIVFGKAFFLETLDYREAATAAALCGAGLALMAALSAGIRWIQKRRAAKIKPA